MQTCASHLTSLLSATSLFACTNVCCACQCVSRKSSSLTNYKTISHNIFRNVQSHSSSFIRRQANRYNWYQTGRLGDDRLAMLYFLHYTVMDSYIAARSLVWDIQLVDGTIANVADHTTGQCHQLAMVGLRKVMECLCILCASVAHTLTPPARARRSNNKQWFLHYYTISICVCVNVFIRERLQCDWH